MSNLRHALAAVARGWAIFPVNPRGTTCPQSGDTIDKMPHLMWPGKPYKLKWGDIATSNPEQVTRWWQHSPHANIGIACRPSGLLVVDCDIAKDGTGTDGLNQFLDICRQLRLDTAQALNTRIVVTGSGGAHLYYTWPAGVQASQAGLGAYGAPLVDIRSNGGSRGGYVLGAGSVTSKGAYAVDHDAPVRRCPPELIELCRDKPKPKPPPSPYAQPGGGNYGGLVDAVMYAAEGNRNDTLNWAAWKMRADGVTEEEALELLLPAADACGLSEKEATDTIRSAYRGN